MYSDLIEEIHSLQSRVFDLENAITEHAQKQFVFGASPSDLELWDKIGLRPYTLYEKDYFDNEDG